MVKKKLHKGGFVDIGKITSDRYLTLLPEYYLRPYEPKYITIIELQDEIEKIEHMVEVLNK